MVIQKGWVLPFKWLRSLYLSSFFFFVRLPCVSPGPLVMTVLFSIPSCKTDLWCMWHLYLPMDVLSLSAPRLSACQSALPRTAWDHSCHNDPTIEKNNLLIFSQPDWNYGCSWNSSQFVFINRYRPDTKHVFAVILIYPTKPTPHDADDQEYTTDNLKDYICRTLTMPAIISSLTSGPAPHAFVLVSSLPIPPLSLFFYFIYLDTNIVLAVP